MFELPEIVTLAKQMNETIQGKTVAKGCLGNSPHKFVWYNRSPEEFEKLTQNKEVGRAYNKGRWLFLPLQPGYLLLLGECGGKLLYHAPRTPLPAKYHLLVGFTDGSALSMTTQMWGAMELYEQGTEVNRQYIKEMRPTPSDPTFTFDYFKTLLDSLQSEKRTAKSLLTQDQLIPGLGNSIAQDILFKAHLHPKHSLQELTNDQQRVLYQSILATVQEVIENGGRNDETDLFGQPGGYVRLMDSRAAGQPCPVCATTIEKIQYLGGACYFCPQCQR